MVDDLENKYVEVIRTKFGTNKRLSNLFDTLKTLSSTGEVPCKLPVPGEDDHKLLRHNSQPPKFRCQQCPKNWTAGDKTTTTARPSP